MFVRVNKQQRDTLLQLTLVAVLSLCLSVPEADAADSWKRRRVGKSYNQPVEMMPPVIDPGAIEPPSMDIPRRAAPIPDRWRLLETLGLQKDNWLDPYNHNTLKADAPIHDDWFINLSLISDTVIEPRRIPTPVGPVTSNRAGSIDVIGSGDQLVMNENLIFNVVYYKGDTIFRPPDYEYRLTAVFNANRVEVDELRALRIDSREGDTRNDDHVGIQDLYVDKHLRNVSERYDFDSVRIGVQPITADFRGFLFIDNPFGIRLFGTRNNNIYQYNIGWFRRIEKDTNSGLNDLAKGLRDDDVFLFNLYIQDYPSLGFNSQIALAHNRNDENSGNFYDNNGFLVRPTSLGTEQPRSYQVTYLGYSGDGHFGRHNVSGSMYYAFGHEDRAVFTGTPSDISALFAAVEYSRDYDWIRARLAIVYGSGDRDPFDDKSTGYDAIFENPLIAGADTSFWIRQPVANIGGGGVTLSGRNGILNSLRSSKDQGQSNFTNPGIVLLGAGMDFDVLPEWRISWNANHIWFDDTAVMEVARNQGNIDKAIGWDVSVASIYRPFMSQNIVFRLSAAALLPGKGYQQLFGDEINYSVLANLVLTY